MRETPLLKPLVWALLGSGLAVMTTAGAIDSAWLHRDKPAALAPATAAVAAGLAPLAQVAPLAALPPGASPNYRAIVLQYGPAVAGVTVEGSRKVGRDEGDADPAQRDFRHMPGWRGGAPEAQPFKGQGSGFIVSADGLILTNAHVVKDAKAVAVRLADRREFAATVLGSDPITDIAVLRIAAQGLPTVHLGDPRSLQVGDPVLAIGAPYGLEQTATAGIVSAKGRSLPGDAAVPFIQTDAAVNPGNSGGPLFDAAGNVVGINAQIYSRSGGFQGMSFAIPVDLAMRVSQQKALDVTVALGRAGEPGPGGAVADLGTDEGVDSPRLGLALRPLRRDERAQARIEHGLLVQGVQGAAARAGLAQGDVVMAINGQPVDQIDELRRVLARQPRSVALLIWRGGERLFVPVQLG